MQLAYPQILVKNNFVYLLTSVHNDADATDDTDAAHDTDNTDDADDYNRVIGIALLKDFSCANNKYFKYM